MASSKGEFTLRLKGQEYRFKLGTSALIALQELVSPPERTLPIEEILIGVSQGRLKFVRAMLWAGIQKHHEGTTLEDVSDLIDEASDVEIKKLLRDLGWTMQPDPKDVEELGAGKQKRPRKARRPNGTGAKSTSQPGPQGSAGPSLAN